MKIRALAGETTRSWRRWRRRSGGGGSSEEQGPGFNRLVIHIGKKRHSIKFYQTELEDATGTPGGDRQLKRRIDAFFKML